jgi:hypothetical protein
MSVGHLYRCDPNRSRSYLRLEREGNGKALRLENSKPTVSAKAFCGEAFRQKLGNSLLVLLHSFLLISHKQPSYRRQAPGSLAQNCEELVEGHRLLSDFQSRLSNRLCKLPKLPRKVNAGLFRSRKSVCSAFVTTSKMIRIRVDVPNLE